MRTGFFGKSGLCLLAVLLAVVTPALAQEAAPADPRITAYNAQKARYEADKARLDAMNAAADARFSNLQRFAGNGEARLGTNGGQMETAYLAAVSMRSVARAIDRRVTRLLGVDADNRAAASPAPRPRVLLLTSTDPLSFDRYVAFRAEISGLADMINRALETSTQPMRNCVRTETRGGFAPLLATAGSLLNLFQSETEVTGFDGLGDSEQLIDALIEANPTRYILPDALSEVPTSDSELTTLLAQLDTCEQAATTRLAERGLAAPTKTRLEALLERATAIRDRIMTPAADGSVPYVTLLRLGALLATDHHVLRVDVERAGGTLITRKNLWTALGAPAIVISGGVDATFRLGHRQTGHARGGRIMCRTGLTGLRDAIRLRYEDISCADGMVDGAEGTPVVLEYSGEVFDSGDAASRGRSPGH